MKVVRTFLRLDTNGAVTLFGTLFQETPSNAFTRKPFARLQFDSIMSIFSLSCSLFTRRY